MKPTAASLAWTLALIAAVLAGTSCVPVWSSQPIATKADRALVKGMAGEWILPVDPDARGASDSVSLSMVPGKTSLFYYRSKGNLETWSVMPIQIGKHVFADVRLLASRSDSLTIDTWSVPPDTLRKFHLIARLLALPDTLIVGFLDDDATSHWLADHPDLVHAATVEDHGTDLTLFDSSQHVRDFLKSVEDEDSLFEPPVVFVRAR
jgi:hypothetical protein